MKEIRVYFTEDDGNQYHLNFKLPDKIKQIKFVDFIDYTDKGQSQKRFTEQ